MRLKAYICEHLSNNACINSALIALGGQNYVTDVEVFTVKFFFFSIKDLIKVIIIQQLINIILKNKEH